MQTRKIASKKYFFFSLFCTCLDNLAEKVRVQPHQQRLNAESPPPATLLAVRLRLGFLPVFLRSGFAETHHRSEKMLIPKKDRNAILTYLFKGS